jgi:hypothetical protein
MYFGAKQENGTLGKRYVYELYEIFNELHIANYIYLTIWRLTATLVVVPHR